MLYVHRGLPLGYRGDAHPSDYILIRRAGAPRKPSRNPWVHRSKVSAPPWPLHGAPKVSAPPWPLHGAPMVSAFPLCRSGVHARRQDVSSPPRGPPPCVDTLSTDQGGTRAPRVGHARGMLCWQSRVHPPPHRPWPRVLPSIPPLATSSPLHTALVHESSPPYRPWPRVLPSIPPLATRLRLCPPHHPVPRVPPLSVRHVSGTSPTCSTSSTGPDLG